MFNRRSVVLRCALYAAIIITPHVARAASASVNTPVIIATPGSTGMFEISYSASFTPSTATDFSLTLTATTVTATGLSFTSVSMSTTPNTYIFAGSSNDAASMTAFSSNTFPNTTFTYADSDTNVAGATVSPFSTVGLAEVLYSVDLNATPGVYTLTTSGTLNQSGSPLVFDLFPGTFTIAPVPEPGDGLLCALGLVVMFFLVARHRQTPT